MRIRDIDGGIAAKPPNAKAAVSNRASCRAREHAVMNNRPRHLRQLTKKPSRRNRQAWPIGKPLGGRRRRADVVAPEALAAGVHWQNQRISVMSSFAAGIEIDGIAFTAAVGSFLLANIFMSGIIIHAVLAGCLLRIR